MCGYFTRVTTNLSLKVCVCPNWFDSIGYVEDILVIDSFVIYFFIHSLTTTWPLVSKHNTHSHWPLDKLFVRAEFILAKQNVYSTYIKRRRHFVMDSFLGIDWLNWN